MRRPGRWVMILALGLLAFCGTGGAQPTIPKKNISPDIPKKVRRWIERLYWTSEHDRARACARLTELKEEAHPAIPYLVAILHDRPKVREAAATALAFMGEPAVGPLMGALRHKDAVVREQAADALLRMGPVAARTIAWHLRSPEPPMRENAAHLLMRIGQPGTDEMIALMTDDNEDLRNYVMLKLKVAGKFNETAMTKALSSRDQRVRLGAVRGLAAVGGPAAVKPLIGTLGDKSPKIREQAALGLGDIGDAQALRPLLAKVKDRRPEVRAAVATALGKLGDPVATRALTTLAEQRNMHVRIAALVALGRMKDPSLVKPMGKMLKNPKTDRYVRGAAVKGIALIGGPEAVTLLSEASNDRDMYVRIKAIEALGTQGEAGIAPLVALLDDKNVLSRAITALGNTRHPAAMTPLEKIFETAGYGTRCAIFAAMVKLGKPGLKRVVDALRSQVAGPRPEELTMTILANALASVGKPGLSTLLEALEDPASPAREQAAEAIRFHLNDRAAVAMLVEALTEKDSFVNEPLAAALTRITGVPLAANRADWQAWWEKNKPAYPAR